MERKITNICGLAVYKKNLSLGKIASVLENSDFNPDLFPGLIYRPRELKPISVLLFATGKIVVTGAKSLDEWNKAVDHVFEVLDNIE